MDHDFPRIITLLRKEKNLSQKQAAQELGISQALLSHYEKGVRECGLDFVIKAADFYNVSCDYLLGRSAERSFEEAELGDSKPKGLTAGDILNRHLMNSAMSVIYDQFAQIGNRRLTRTLTSYMLIGVYRVFRFLYSAGGDDHDGLFSIPKELYDGYSTAAQIKLLADVKAMSDKDSDSYIPALGDIRLSADSLPKEYPNQAPALFNVIRQAENSIEKIRK